jgi:hypothetical protein
VQDLLAPEKDNIAITEDPKTGDVSVPGATQVQIQDQSSFVRLLDVGEANRFAANTKLNTESSRSHAILLVSRLPVPPIFLSLFLLLLTGLACQFVHHKCQFWPELWTWVEKLAVSLATMGKGAFLNKMGGAHVEGWNRYK